jgi:hypothetical protein
VYSITQLNRIPTILNKNPVKLNIANATIASPVETHPNHPAAPEKILQEASFEAGAGVVAAAGVAAAGVGVLAAAAGAAAPKRAVA